MAPRHKLAINPLPWVLSETGFDLSVARLTPALEQLGAVGYKAVHADIPEGMSSAEYASFIGSFGFDPAPGYFGGAFEDSTARSATVESARRHASGQAALGLTEVFIATSLSPERMAMPTAGAAASSERIQVISDGLAAAAEAMKAEGVTPALHPHVGTWVEVEAEIRAVLDATAGSALAFGPDTGHLAWAGMDPAAVISDYSDRVIATHLKDVDAAAASAAREAGADYFVATGQFHVWTEPGRGSVDFDAVFAALPADFDGWSVVEVDVPNIGTPMQSAEAAREYLLGLDFFAGDN